MKNKIQVLLILLSTILFAQSPKDDNLLRSELNGNNLVNIGWVNLQWPSSANIARGESITAYAQIWIDGVTSGGGAGSGISAWIGYSSSNTNPDTWTNWVPATYNTDVGNNDEFMASIGSTLESGTYYFASRFQYSGSAYSYGGYSSGGGGFWNGTANISGVLTVQATVPSVPLLITPGNSSGDVGLFPNFIWNSSENATHYRLQVATDAAFSSLVFNDSTITDTLFTLIIALDYNKQYFWRVSAKNAEGSSAFSVSWSFTTLAGIGWVNLQFPLEASISSGGSATFYARVYASGITEPLGQGAGITGWIGYSITNTNPNTWTNWVPATYNTDQGNNDEYQATIGSTLPAGTYYVASRFQLGSGSYVYGGYNAGGGGYWDGTNNVSATLNVSVPAPNAPTLVSPLDDGTGISTLPTLTWNSSENANSYRLIVATDTNFTDKVFNDSTITDTTKILATALDNNKKYYWKVNAKNNSGTSGYSGRWSFTTVATIGWANLQFPESASIEVGGNATFYLRVFAQNITEATGQGAGITGWIGYSITNTNPSTWTNWVPATYNTDQGNNDEYQATIGSTLPAGTYYVASRFQLGSGSYVYGGYNAGGGGYWDGTNNVSATLNVTNPMPGIPLLVSPLQGDSISIQPITLIWKQSENGERYHLQFSADSQFTAFSINDSLLTDTTKQLGQLTAGDYFWRVRSNNSGGTSEWSEVRKFTIKTYCERIVVETGWNIISIPLLSQSMETQQLFPDFTSPTYGYNNGYQTKTALENGKGYWIRYGITDTIEICGERVEADSIPIKAGWNLIGVYGYELVTANIVTTPAQIINSSFYGYSNGYSVPNKLSVGKGYWIRSSQDGEINLTSNLAKTNHDGLCEQIINPEWGIIKVRDNKNREGVLYVSKTESDLNYYDLPPIPPAEIFDVRYNSDRYAENIREGKELVINGAEFPVVLKVTGLEIRVNDVIGGQLINKLLKDGEEIVITNPGINKLKIESVEIPIEYNLSQNYPNPFNPSTVISYQLPVNSKVSLKVFDVLGNEVATLVNQEQVAGKYEFTFEASRFASGVYLYRLQAGEFVSVKKLVLMK